jgi:phytoene dehydrogenase-like protein
VVIISGGIAGLAGSFEGEAGYLVFPPAKPMHIDGTDSVEDMHVRIFNFYPTLAPREKDRIAQNVINALDGRFGNIGSMVEVYDVATPATLIRYTNSWKGSFEGWLPVAGGPTRRMKKELPGLNNVYMVGQWVEPGGGLPMAIMSGRVAAQVICKREGKSFVTR